jgi:hypothetical protein
MKPTLPLLLVASIAMAAVRCSSDVEPAAPSSPLPVPGTVTLVVVSPNGPEGAAFIEVDAAAVTNVMADSGSVLHAPQGERLRIAIVRGQPGTLRVHLTVRDTASALDPELVQVADPANTLRPMLAGYSVEVVR